MCVQLYYLCAVICVCIDVSYLTYMCVQLYYLRVSSGHV
jgi:hypothetical protein